MYLLIDKIFRNREIYKKIILYSLGVFLFLIPFFLIIIFTLLSSDGYSFEFLLGHKISYNTYLKKILNWFFHLINLNGYIIIILIIAFLFKISLFKSRIVNLLLTIISVHFILNILLNIIEISYIRNYYYIHHILIILSSVFLYRYFITNKNLYIKIILVLLLILNCYSNLNLILNKNEFLKKNSFFYNFYFNKQGEVKRTIKYLIDSNLLNKNYNIIFFNQLTIDYFKIYASDIYYLSNSKDNLLSIEEYSRNNDYNSKKRTSQFTIINSNHYVISIEDDPSQIFFTFNNLKKIKLIDKRCNIEHPFFQKEILPLEFSGDFKKKLMINKINCTNILY